MKPPTQCELWDHPERLETPDRFEQIEMLEDDSHLIRRLLKCRECGQLYFYEFYEEIDWKDGNDPQYRTWIPVQTQEEIAALKDASPFGILQASPRLQCDFPRDAKEPGKPRWIRA